jgi:isopenicillin-N N-acyltransferase-like protein
MKTKIFKGNFFEIGEQQGRLYKANGMKLLDNIQVDSTLYQNQLRIYEKHYPEFLEELSGIAEAGNYDKNKLIYSAITSEISLYRNTVGLLKQCTIFGYKDDKSLYIGRNYDWFPASNGIFDIYKVINPERNSFIAVTDLGIMSPETATSEYYKYIAADTINDKGLFIGLTFAYAAQWAYGISNPFMAKLIAETCETVEEALNVFEKVPLCCPKNFLIADKNGNMAVVEHIAKKFKVLYPKDNILIQTNHYVDAELAEEDIGLKQNPTNTNESVIRYNETLRKVNLEKGKFNLSSIIKILGRPRVYQDNPNAKTIWTLALDMSNKKYKIYWNVSKNRKVKNLEI